MYTFAWSRCNKLNWFCSKAYFAPFLLYMCTILLSIQQVRPKIRLFAITNYHVFTIQCVVWNVPLVIIIIVIMMVRHAAFLVLGELCKQVMKIKSIIAIIWDIWYHLHLKTGRHILRDNDISIWNKKGWEKLDFI